MNKERVSIFNGCYIRSKQIKIHFLDWHIDIYDDNTRLCSTAHYDFNKPSIVTVIGEPDECKGVLRVY